MNSANESLVLLTRIVMALYAGLTIFLVIRGARKIKNIEDYAVGSILFSPYAVGLALAASMTSAATFIINPGLIAYYGISGFISYGVVLPVASMTSLVFLTKSFRRHGTTVKALSMAQWMGTRYNSKGYGLFFAFTSLLLITFIVLICVGLTKVLAKALNFEEVYVLTGIAVFIFGYMMFGGANSMVYTNTIQALLMLIVAFILLGSGYEHFSEGVKGFLVRLEAVDANLVTLTNPESFLFRDFFEIIGSQLIIGVAIVCQPHIITKSLLLKSDKDVHRYLTTGVIVQTLFFLVVFAGLYARLSFPDLQINGTVLKVDGVIPAYVISEFPVYVGIIVILGLMSAGISTLEGLIQSLATTITSDIIKPLFIKSKDESGTAVRMLLINKMVIIGLGIAAVFLSYEQLINPNVSVAIFAQNGVYAYFSAAFLPILLGMFVKNINRAIPIAASVTALIVHFSMFYLNLPVPFTLATGQNPGVSAAAAILVSAFVAGIVYILTGKKSDE
ncbi:MAG: sodium:solute symporter [Ignavibacteriales bacterium]|nr:MAG: sodium:solute symporter [Ignavibacteriales bacterium]